jgi:hypothetical protein
VADPGRRRRGELARLLGVAEGRPLVLVSMGGIGYGLDCAAWPASPDLFFLAPGAVPAARGDMASIDALDLPFPDLLASVDVLLTKPGYGSFVEAACGGLAVAYLRRERWPEEAALLEWLRDHARCMEVGEPALHRGDFRPALRMCLDAPRPPPVRPAGVAQAAGRLADLLRGGPCHSAGIDAAGLPPR